MDQELEMIVSESNQFQPKHVAMPLLLELVASDYQCQQGLIFKMDRCVTE